MKILITGANGYIGSRLLQMLLEAKHEVYALVRHSSVPPLPISNPNLHVINADLLDTDALSNIPKDIDVAFYLVHAMSYGKDFPEKEKIIAKNFLLGLKHTEIKQVIYLSALSSKDHLSEHMASRLHTEKLIQASGIPYTILRAGIIIGSGSASFEILKDLTEKLPIMIAPRWVNNLCQPIAVQDILRYLLQVMLVDQCMNQIFDVGGPDKISYKEMMLVYAKVRGLKRHIFVVPVLTLRLSSYWLYFITSVNFNLASSLIDSLSSDAICRENRIKSIFPDPCMTYKESIKQALEIIEQNPMKSNVL